MNSSQYGMWSTQRKPNQNTKEAKVLRDKYSDWRPMSDKSQPLWIAGETPKKVWGGANDKESKFNFTSCTFCFDVMAFECRQCTMKFCANEECKEMHNDHHVMVRLAS